MRNLVLVLAVLFPLSAPAGDFPTPEVVRVVVTCMAAHGGNSEENLNMCACRYDHISSKMPYRDYEQADLFQRYVNMPGKRGALFRDSKAGEVLVEKLEVIRKEAEKQCPVVKRIEAPKKTDKPEDQPAG